RDTGNGELVPDRHPPARGGGDHRGGDARRGDLPRLSIGLRAVRRGPDGRHGAGRSLAVRRAPAPVASSGGDAGATKSGLALGDPGPAGRWLHRKLDRIGADDSDVPGAEERAAGGQLQRPDGAIGGRDQPRAGGIPETEAPDRVRPGGRLAAGAFYLLIAALPDGLGDRWLRLAARDRWSASWECARSGGAAGDRQGSGAEDHA